MATKPPVERGLTVAHLLTLMVRKQYDGWMKTVGKMVRASTVECATQSPDGFSCTYRQVRRRWKMSWVAVREH